MKEYSIKNKNTAFGEQGFSLVELIIVMLVISILSVLTLMAFRGDKKFLADSEAYSILDILNEAKQRAITQHETLRVEINKTRNTIRLITENAAGDATDDQVVRTLILEHPNYVSHGSHSHQRSRRAGAYNRNAPIIRRMNNCWPENVIQWLMKPLIRPAT